MNIKTKFIYVALIMVLSIMMMGCQKDIPKGDIKDFVDAFDYKTTFNNVLYGSSTVTSSNYKDGVEQGTITTYTYIDRRDGLYHYSHTILSGDYYGDGEDQFMYYEKETISYINDEGLIIAFEKTDGVVEEITYRREDIDTLINYFYYTNSDNNYHKGGAYYGDYILANCARYYNLFSLNEDKTELSFEVNVAANDTNGKKIITMHKYLVDKYGMVINLSTLSVYKEDDDTYSETTMNCDYKINFEKIYNFN